MPLNAHKDNDMAMTHARAPSRQGTGPVRRCLATGTAKPVDGLLRFVVGPGNDVVPDLDGRLPGRGLWLSAERDMVNTACIKGLFAKGARRAVTAPADLADRVDALLARRCLDGIGLARRAGDAVAGFEKVRSWVRAKRAALILVAADGGDDGKNKARAMAGERPLVDVFDAAALGAVMGRSRAVHVALAAGPLADRLRRDAGRLAVYRGGNAAQGTGD